MAIDLTANSDISPPGTFYRVSFYKAGALFRSAASAETSIKPCSAPDRLRMRMFVASTGLVQL